MKIASLYRKGGKTVLETDNNAMLQLATDTPQDVIVAPPPSGDACVWAAAHYGHDLHPEARLAGRPPAMAAPYGQNAPPAGMVALQQIATELRRRNAGPPAPKPVLGVELHEWADRIEAVLAEAAPPVLTGDTLQGIVAEMCRREAAAKPLLGGEAYSWAQRIEVVMARAQQDSARLDYLDTKKDNWGQVTAVWNVDDGGVRGSIDKEMGNG